MPNSTAPAKALTPSRMLIIILVIYIAWSVIYAALVPPWESPDEPAHYLYVAYLAQHGVPPGPSPVKQSGRFYMGGFVTSMYEWHHPALGYVPHAVIYQLWSMFNASSLPQTFPPVNPGLILGSFTNDYLFLPEVPEPLGWLQRYPGLFALRLTSSLLGALAIVCIWGIGVVIWPQEPAFALTAAMSVAFIPEFIFINASVRNDSATFLISAAATWLLVRHITHPGPLPQRRTLLCLGLMCTVAWLAKSTVLFVLPLTAAVLAFTYPCPRAWPKLAGWLSMPLAVGVGLYYLIFPQARQGFADIQQFMRIDQHLLNWKTLTDGLPLLRDLFWARFGWANVVVPPLWTQIPTALGLGGIALSIGVIVNSICAGRLSVTTKRQMAILALVVGLVVMAFFRLNAATFQPQGRYLFLAIGPLAILAILGAWQLAGKWGRRSLSLGIAGGLTLLNLGSITQGIYPTYYKAVLPSAFQDKCSTPVGELYGKTTYGQSFVARHPNLSRIDVMMATYGRENHLPVVFHLRRGLPGETDQDIVTLKVPPTVIADDAYHSFVFSAIPDSQNQVFYFYLASPRSMPGDAFTLWSTSEDAYPEGTRTVDDRPAQGDLCFIAYSDLGAR